MLKHFESGRGSVVVLLHAFPFDGGLWAKQVEVLSGSHRVIVPDLPGFGQSTAVNGWTIDSAARLVDELLQSLVAGEPVVVGGLSIGGYIALALARLFPQRLSGLILADTKSEADSEEAKAGRAALIEKVQAAGTVALAEAMLPKVLGRTTQQENAHITAQVLGMMMRQPAPAVIAAIEALRDRPDATPGLSKIAVPSLVIVGSEDTVTPPAQSEAMAKAIPQAKLVRIPKAGHLANLEAPALFNEAVTEFLKGLS